jgi:hypothetical protein
MDIEKELKIYWILGIIVLLIYGLWFFISYESYYAISGGGAYFHPVIARVLGGVYIAWTVVLLKLYKEIDNWEKIESWMLFAVLMNIFTLISEFIGIVVYNILTAGAIIVIIIDIFFIIVGIHIIMQKRV